MASPGYQTEPLNIQLLVDSIPALIHTARPDGYIDYFNRPWLEYLGVTLDKVTGWNWTNFIHPEDLKGIVDKWRGCLASGEIFEYETRVRRADGNYRWMFHRKVPLRDAYASIVKWYGSSLDIEERKSAEQALQISQAYLAEAQKLSHTGSWANAPTGEPRYWSEECYRVLGFDSTEPLPSLDTIFQRIYPDDRAAMREQLERGIRDKKDFEVELRIVHPITGIRNIRSLCHAVVDTRGDLREIVGTVIDITEHRRAEEAIRRSEAYLAEAQKLSHTGSFGWKVSSGEIFWSDETFRIFECDPSSKPTIEFILSRVHRDDHDMAQQQIDGALRNGEGFDFEHRLQMPDGSVKHVRVTARPSKDSAGDVEFVGAVTDITERKGNEEKFRRLVEAGILGIYFATVEGGIVEANQAFLQLLQYDRQDLASGRLRWADITPAEWLERDERSMAEFLATGVFQAYEKEYFRKDGSRVPVLVGGARMQTPNEGVVFVLDLSEQKRAEEKTRRSESYLSEAQRISQTGSFAWSPGESITYWSEECYRVLGFDPQDGLPRAEEFIQRIHPDDRRGFVELVETGTREKTGFESYYRVVHPDGTVRNIHVVCHPVLNPSGHLVEFLGTVMDVTEHELLTQELRRREAFLTEAQRLSHTGSFGWDPDSDEILWSDETYRIFEYDPIVKPTRELVLQRVHPEERAKLHEAIARVSEGATQYEHIYRLLLPDGRVKHVRIFARVMEQITGRPLFIGTLQDVTESKLAEEALNKARSELANVGRITTLNALTASIAHEVNQPLAGIVTNASTCLRMLHSDPPNVDGARETARRTIRDGNRASDVITRLRALFSKKEFTLEPLDLNDATREVIALSLSDLQRNRVILRSELAEDLPPVIGDRVQLQQVILNLVRNASDAMTTVEDRPRELLIRTEKNDSAENDHGTGKYHGTEKDDCGRVRLSVKDAGIGFTPEARAKLFEAFYTTKNDGMGIGLSISRSIIETHHGHLWAVPNDGPGVTFSFSVPCRSGS